MIEFLMVYKVENVKGGVFEVNVDINRKCVCFLNVCVIFF